MTKLVCLDPGHSGCPDVGAVGQISYEYEEAWLIAKRVQEILEQSPWNIKTVMTKKEVKDKASDSLAYRCEIANQNDVDIFVSIHLNSFSNPQARGTETYHAQGSVSGKKLATQIHNQLLSCLGFPDRGIKTANYYVLLYTNVPAVLVEVGFISNPTEEKLIQEKRETIAQAIAQGIIDYFYYEGELE